jgi:hypothetical protein
MIRSLIMIDDMDMVHSQMDEDPHNGEFWGALGGEITVTATSSDDTVDALPATALTLRCRLSPVHRLRGGRGPSSRACVYRRASSR